MLFWKAKEIFEGGGELLKAEAELAGARFRRALVGLLFTLLTVLLGSVGLLILMAGSVILLAPILGWGGAMLCIGGGVMLLSMLAIMIRPNRSQRSQARTATGSIAEEPMPPAAEAEQAKERMASALDAQKPDDDAGSGQDPVEDMKQEAIDFAVRHPEIIAGAALLAVSIVGPGRSLRLLSKGVTTASLVHSAFDALSSNSGNERPCENITQHPTQSNGVKQTR